MIPDIGMSEAREWCAPWLCRRPTLRQQVYPEEHAIGAAIATLPTQVQGVRLRSCSVTTAVLPAERHSACVRWAGMATGVCSTHTTAWHLSCTPKAHTIGASQTRRSDITLTVLALACRLAQLFMDVPSTSGLRPGSRDRTWTIICA
jgi:hypothetical protein